MMILLRPVISSSILYLKVFVKPSLHVMTLLITTFRHVLTLIDLIDLHDRALPADGL